MVGEEWETGNDTLTGDGVMEEYIGNIAPGALVNILHQVLIHGCNVDNSEAFKNGYFSNVIVWHTPILSCLRLLANSPSVTIAESIVFDDVREALEAVMAKVERLEDVSREERVRTFNISRNLVFVFQSDNLAHRYAENSKKMLLAAYHEDLLDEPAMLLHFTRDVLIRGVNDLAYLDGHFKGKIHSDTDILVALNMF